MRIQKAGEKYAGGMTKHTAKKKDPAAFQPESMVKHEADGKARKGPATKMDSRWMGDGKALRAQEVSFKEDDLKVRRKNRKP